MTDAPQIVPGRRAPYVQVPFALIEDRKLNATAFRVWAALARFCDFGSENGARPSVRRLGEVAGIKTTALRETLLILREAGWVEWESGKEAGTPNRYIVHFTPAGVAGKPERGVAGKATTGVAGKATTTEILSTERQLPREKPPAQTAAPAGRSQLSDRVLGTNANPKPTLIAKAIDLWDATHGLGSGKAVAGEIAKRLSALVAAGNPEATVLDHFGRFAQSEDSRYGVTYFAKNLSSYGPAPATAPPPVRAPMPPSDLSRARSCGSMVEQALRDRGAGESWQQDPWYRAVVAEAVALGRHPAVLAFERLHTLPKLNGAHATTAHDA